MYFLIYGGITMTITSTAFSEGGMIPSKFTCDGADLSPALSWNNVPDGTKSFVLISDDPDAPMGTWVHWVLYDIPGTERNLPEGVPKTAVLKNGAKHGESSFHSLGYGGPCPPGGTHRYYFKLYALDIALNQKPGLTKKQALPLMQGHILAEASLMGKYARR